VDLEQRDQKHFSKRKLWYKLQILQRPKSTSERFAESFAGMGQQLPEIFGKLQERQTQQNQAKSFGQYMSEDPEEQKMFQKLHPDIQKSIATEKAKNLFKTPAEKPDTKGLSDALDWLDENIEYTGSTSIPFTKSFMPFGKITTNRKSVEKREEIDATGFWAADQVFTHFNKGTVSKEKLKTIKEDLAPRSGLSEREYKARVSALRRLSSLPRNLPKAQFDKEVDKEKRSMDKISKYEEKNKRPPLSSFHR
jgi:hypothetical protein